MTVPRAGLIYRGSLRLVKSDLLSCACVAVRAAHRGADDVDADVWED